MGQMAFLTVQLTVFTRVVNQLRALIVMAADAYRFDGSRCFKVDFERIVRVMTGNAIVDGVMGFSRRIMTHGAGRNDFRTLGRMLQMAVEAGDGGVVLASACGDVRYDFIVGILHSLRCSKAVGRPELPMLSVPVKSDLTQELWYVSSCFSS